MNYYFGRNLSTKIFKMSSLNILVFCPKHWTNYLIVNLEISYFLILRLSMFITCTQNYQDFTCMHYDTVTNYKTLNWVKLSRHVQYLKRPEV